MNIPVEIIAFIIAPLGTFVVIMIVLTLIKWLKIRRYKPENDKGKLAEESRRMGRGRIPLRGRREEALGNYEETPLPRRDEEFTRRTEESRGGSSSVQRPLQSERRRLLPSAGDNELGKIRQVLREADRSYRETSRSDGKAVNPFRRYR